MTYKLTTTGNLAWFRLNSGAAFEYDVHLNTALGACLRDLVPAIPYELHGPATVTSFPARDPSPISISICCDWMIHNEGLQLFAQHNILPNDYDVGDSHNWVHRLSMKQMLRRLTPIKQGITTLLQHEISNHLSA